MKQLFLFFSCFGFYAVQAQQNVLTGNVTSITTYTIHGMPPGSKLENIKSGSVFFKDDWMNSTIVLKDGQQFKNIKAKLNLFENKVHYLNNNTELVSDSPISDVILQDSVNDISYHFVNYNSSVKPAATDKERWFLSLAEGPVSLYKILDKSIEESRGYNSAIIDRTIETKEQYFVLYKGQLRRVNKVRELPGIMFDKQNELSQFIKQHSKNPFEQQLKDAVAYYNSFK